MSQRDFRMVMSLLQSCASPEATQERLKLLAERNEKVIRLSDTIKNQAAANDTRSAELDVMDLELQKREKGLNDYALELKAQRIRLDEDSKAQDAKAAERTRGLNDREKEIFARAEALRQQDLQLKDIQTSQEGHEHSLRIRDDTLAERKRQLDIREAEMNERLIQLKKIVG